MKKILLLLALAMPLLAGAMKIEVDEIDEFTGKRLVATSWEKAGQFKVRFRLENNFRFLDLAYTDEYSCISMTEGSNLMFKSSSDSIVSLTAVRTEIAHAITGAHMWIFEDSFEGNVEWFEGNTPVLARLYATGGYITKKISEADGAKIQKLAMLFFGTLRGDPAVKISSCTLRYMKSKKGKNKWELVNEEYLKDAIQSEIDAKVSDWKAKSNDYYDYDVVIKKAK